jgi:predicted membrane protein
LVKWIGIGLGAIGIITIAFIVAGYIFDTFRVETRDIAIVLVGVFLLINAILVAALLLALLYLVFFIRRTVNNTVVPQIEALKGKLDQVIDTTGDITNNVRETTSTVSSTTTYVAEKAVAPVIRVSGLLAGVRAGAAYLARRGSPPDLDNA